MRNKLDKVEEVVKLLKAQPIEKTAGIRVEITLSGMDSFKELRETLNEDYFVDLFAGNDPIIGVYSVPVQPQLAYALTILRRFRLLLRGDQNKAIPRNIHEKLTGGRRQFILQTTRTKPARMNQIIVLKINKI